MPSVQKKSVMDRKKREAVSNARQPGKLPEKIVWVYQPLDLPFEPRHLSKQQIQDAVDKLPV